MLVMLLVLILIGLLTTLGMRRLQSQLEPWDDTRHFRG
jgi:hypothetical protein